MRTIPGRYPYPEEMLDQLNEGLIIIDDENRISFINRAARTILGIRRNGSSRQQLRDCINGPNLEFIELVEEGCGKSKRLKDQEVQYRRGNSLLRLVVSIFPIKDRPVHGPCHLIIVNNITELWRLHNRERSHLGRLRRSYTNQIEILQAIADSVAHEVRNPISSIGGYADLLLKKCGDPAQDKNELAKYLIYIKEDADRLNSIVSLVERYSDMSDIKLRRENAILVFRDALRIARKLAIMRNRPIEFPHIDSDEYYIFVDKKKLRAAFMDIFSQSLEWSVPDRPLIVDFQFSPYEASLNVEFLTEKIRRGDMHFIFNPFMLTYPRKPSFNLSLAQRIIILHGGIIDVSLQQENRLVQRVVFPREKRDIRG